MKRKIYCALVLATACLTMAGCGKDSSEGTLDPGFESLTETVASKEGEQTSQEQTNTEQPTDTQNTTETAEAPANDGRVSILDETTELDYNKDYDEEIKVAVERAVASATSFEDEFNQMGLIQDHITQRRSQDQSQAEMNMASYFYFQVWDAELNNLWDRFSQAVDENTKARLLEEQRAWNALKLWALRMRVAASILSFTTALWKRAPSQDATCWQKRSPQPRANPSQCLSVLSQVLTLMTREQERCTAASL